MACPRAMQERFSVKDVLMGVKRPDGSVSWINVSASPIINEAGNLEGIVGTFADITERKRAEEALRESEERFRSIIKNTAAGYFFINIDGLFQDVNDSWLRMYKYTSADEVLGKHFTVVQKADDVEKAKEFVQGIIEENPRYATGEFSRKCKDDTIGYHTFSARPVSRLGKVIGIEGFIIDTTERKQMEESLRESEIRFRVLSDATFEAIAFTEQERIVDANPQFAEMFGYGVEDLVGLHVEKLVVPKDREFVQNHMLSGSEEPYEHRALRKDGTIIVVEVRPRMMSIQGRPMRVAAIRDITALFNSIEQITSMSEPPFTITLRHLMNGFSDRVLERFYRLRSPFPDPGFQF
jgi:PAS domain S-box-containing protein